LQTLCCDRPFIGAEKSDAVADVRMLISKLIMMLIIDAEGTCEAVRR
jgi:hypothetical protein